MEDWTPKTTKSLRIDSNGQCFAVKETTQPVNSEEALEAVVKRQGFLSPMLAPGSFVFFKEDHTYLMQIVNEVPFRIAMEVDPTSIPKKDDKKADEKIVYMPAFRGGGIETEPVFKYVTPATMRMVFIIPVRYDRDHFLIAQDTRTGLFYHPILPNVYGDGRLCFGQVSRSTIKVKPNRDGFGPYLEKVLATWSNSKWNADLIGGSGADVCGYLKFSEKTRKNLATEKDWTKFSGKTMMPVPVIQDGLNKLHTLMGGNTVEAKK